MSDDEKFFDRYGEYHVRLHFYECDEGIGVEQLYQMFKARMLREAQEIVAEEE